MPVVSACHAGDDNHVPQGSGRQHNEVLDLLNDSTKWVVSAGAGATVLWRRDAQTMWCIIGSVVAALLCKVSMCRARKGGSHYLRTDITPGASTYHWTFKFYSHGVLMKTV